VYVWCVWCLINLHLVASYTLTLGDCRMVNVSCVNLDSIALASPRNLVTARFVSAEVPVNNATHHILVAAIQYSS
jgi:hypothetical protein